MNLYNEITVRSPDNGWLAALHFAALLTFLAVAYSIPVVLVGVLLWFVVDSLGWGWGMTAMWVIVSVLYGTLHSSRG